MGSIQLADEKLYQHWKQNCPELRTAAEEHSKKHVIKGWGQQIEEKKMVFRLFYTSDVKLRLVFLSYAS